MLMRLLYIFFTLILLNGCANKNINVKNGRRVVTRQAITDLHNIALMLPFKSNVDLAATSQAIYNGLLAAYYASSKQNDIKIQTVDTSSGNIVELYKQAVSDGAQVVIGPLTKPEVEAIAGINSILPVPTIALNTLDNYQSKVINNLYQFGLLPQDEADQVAIRMTQENLHKVAIVIPEGMWGEKILNIFADKYTSFGNRVVAVLKYNSSQDMSKQVCNFLADNPSSACAAIQNNTSVIEKPEFILRRKDIDSIFILAVNPAAARQIIPLLKYYYASDLPLYSISTIYNGVTQSDIDRDISGVYFCDMPWVVQDFGSLNSNLQNIYQKITNTSIWQESFSNYKKFYALGIDAYNLAANLNNFLSSPKSGVDGASGTLYLDNFNHIYRKLQWLHLVSA